MEHAAPRRTYSPDIKRSKNVSFYNPADFLKVELRSPQNRRKNSRSIQKQLDLSQSSFEMDETQDYRPSKPPIYKERHSAMPYR